MIPVETAHCPIHESQFGRRAYARDKRLTCSSECRAAWMRIRNESYKYGKGSFRSLDEACREYANQTGPPLQVAMRFWGLA